MAITYTVNPSGISLSKNPIRSLVTSDASGYTTLFLKQVLYRAADDSVVHTLIHTADTNKQAEFNWQQFIDDDIQTTTPDLSASGFTTPSIVKEYYFITSEIEDAVEGTPAQGSDFKVLKGGKGFIGFAEDLGPDLTYSASNEYQFLSTDKQVSRINASAPLPITILPLVGIGAATLVLTATYDDGTTEVVNAAMGTLTADTPKYTNISDEVRGFAALQPSKTWVKLTATISELTGPTLTFLVQQPKSVWQRYFVFQNSLGAFQAITTAGKGTEVVNTTKSTFNKYLAATYTTDQRQVATANHLANTKQQVSSGYKTEAERRVFQDLFLSENVYEYLSYRGQQLLVPINIQDTDLPVKADGENLQAVSFSYAYAFTESNLDQLV